MSFHSSLSLRIVQTCVLAVCVVGHIAHADQLGSSVEGLLAYAKEKSPELASMRLDADAASARTGSAGALPDPMFTVELMNFNNYGNDASASLLPSKVGETKYTLKQSFPLWGKRDLQRNQAAEDAKQASLRASATWLELATKIKGSYLQYYAAVGNERITKEVIDLTVRMEKLAQARYAGGLAAQQDAIRAQLEQTEMRSELIMLQSESRQARAKLNALLARSVSAPLAEPRDLRPLPSLSVDDLDRLVSQAKVNSPSLGAEEAKLRSTELSRDMTWRNRYPDLEIGISPTQMGNRITEWSLMFGINIPLQQSARRAQEKEALAMVEAQRARTEAVGADLLGQLGENLSAFDAARKTEQLMSRQLIPQSELAFQSAQAAYETGRVDFGTLLDAQKQIRKVRADRLRAQVEAQMRFAEIERIVGEDL